MAIILVVILPLALIVASSVAEATRSTSRIQSGDFSPATYFQQIYSARCRSGWACWTALAWAARV
jgi:uncharacterized membrane protein